MQRFIPVTLILLVFFLLIATYFHEISAINQDLGRHILMGKIILENQSVPKTNLLSYTYPNFPFINHHWGSEVLFYLLYQLGGFTLVLFITAFCFITAFLMQLFYTLKKSTSSVSYAHVISTAIISLLSLGILFERTDVRPESFSMLFFSLFLISLFQNREKLTRWIWALIPLQLLWTNIHVYFPIGILTIGLFLLDSIIPTIIVRTKTTKQSHPWNNPASKQLFFLLLTCSLITLFNPNGLSGALYPFHVFANYGYTIQENQTIFFLWEYAGGPSRTIGFFWIYVFFLFTTLLIRGKDTRPIDWLLTITFTILGTQAIRNFPLFVLSSFLPFTYNLTILLSPFLKKASKSFYILSVICCTIIFWQLSYIQSIKPFSIDTPTSAQQAADFFINHHLHGSVFNNFDIGSYFLFRTYPNEKVFVDGRPEAYPAEFFQRTYIPMQEDPKLFDTLSKTYQFTTIFFAHTDQTPWGIQFLHDIIRNKNWKIVYLDNTIIILTLQKNPLPPLRLETFAPKSSTIQGYYEYLVFFQKIDYPEKMVETAQNLLQKDPNNCIALTIILNSSIDQTVKMLYQNRFTSFCN